MGGTIDGGQGTNQVTVTWAPTGTKNINVNYTDVNGCSAISLASFVIAPTVVPSLTGKNKVCFNETGVVYKTDANHEDYLWEIKGGTITSANGTNEITVDWNESAGPHSISINYSDETSHCSALSPTQLIVTVNPLPTASISGTVSVCQNSPQPAIKFTGSGGTREYTFNYEMNGVPLTVATSAGNTVNVNQATGTPGDYTYTLISVRDGNGCSQSATGSASVTVTPTPNATIAYSPNSLCKTTASASVTLTGTPGGTFSATPAGLSINAATGEIAPFRKYSRYIHRKIFYNSCRRLR